MSETMSKRLLETTFFQVRVQLLTMRRCHRLPLAAVAFNELMVCLLVYFGFRRMGSRQSSFTQPARRRRSVKCCELGLRDVLT
jgi:hypothetical protein